MRVTVLSAAVLATFFASAEPSMGGKWICALSGQGNYRPAMRLATDVVMTQTVKRATLRTTALGLYVPFVNGREITSRRLMPGWTQYEHRVPSQEFDVTRFLVVGTNCVAALVGDGWYCGQISYVGRPQGEAGWGRYPCFRAELTLEYANGSVARLGTSAKDWRSFYLNPATLVNDIYQGEEYDALMDDARWKRIGSVGGEVREVVRNVEVVGDIGQPVEVTRVIRPVKIVRRPVGTYLLDFGENVAGVERIRLKKAHRGASIVVRHGEDLDANGNLWRDNLAFAGAKTVLHCGEAAPFEYAPRFTFYGFRYAEVSGWPADEELTDESVTVEVLSSAVRETGGFECSNELINQLFANVRRSQQANFIDVPTDCPQRCERFGWTGDAQIFAETAMMNYDVRCFFAKWLGDVRLCRSSSGAFPDIAPFPPSGADTPAATGSAGWSDVGVVCPWMLYRKYGDRDALREAYPSIVKYVDLIASAEKLGTIGDHLNLGQPTSANYVAEALRIEMHRLAALAARALGETEDAKRFAVRREQLLAQFRTKHLGVDGLPKERTQTAAAFSLVYGIAPGEAARRKTVGLLKELISERGGHLATGFLGTPVLLQPQPGGALSYAKATHEIPGGGVISSAWELKGGSVEWVFEVPEGTEAEVVFPGQPQGPLPSGITEVGGRLVARPGRYCARCAADDLFPERSK